MDINAEVSTQLSLLDALLSLDKPVASCANKKNEKKEEENQDAMPDSTTNTEKTNSNTFNCGDDVLVPNKDGRYYLGTIVELSTSNDNDSCDVGTGVARCLVKFGDGTHAWAPVSTLKLLSAPPADDGRIMCVVCKRREGPAATLVANAIIACDMCGRGYHAKCHTPPVDAWISGASWQCKRCVDQRSKMAAADNRAVKRTDFFRFKGGNRRRQRQELTPPCDTASTSSSTASDFGNNSEAQCYCGETGDWLAQMILCCRCDRFYHQRCVLSLRYPLYAGDRLFIFSCVNCNGGSEYLRRLELCWLDLAHLTLYNLTAYNAPNYFDLDEVIMPYIMDNWHALQLPEKMWRTPASERRDKILTALTSSRKRFKCGREMKKRATIWGLRLRRPPPQPMQLAALVKIKKGEPLTDELVREFAPRLRFLAPPPSPPLPPLAIDSFQMSSSKNDTSSYMNHNERMIVPFDGHWLNLMTGKRFHENLNSNSTSENDSTSSYESMKSNELEEPPPAPAVIAPPSPLPSSSPAPSPLHSPVFPPVRTPVLNPARSPIFSPVRSPVLSPARSPVFSPARSPVSPARSPVLSPAPSPSPAPAAVSTSTAVSGNAKDNDVTDMSDDVILIEEETVPGPSPAGTDVPSGDRSSVQCSTLDILPKDGLDDINVNKNDISIKTHTSRIATMNLEMSKLSTNNIIEHSKIMSLKHMNRCSYNYCFPNELESSGDEMSRGTLDFIIPPLKDFQGKNNPFLMQNSRATFTANLFNKHNIRMFNGKHNNYHSRLSLPSQLNPMMEQFVRPLKRKLSEKDIIIGPNGEVKRRKFRRPRKYLQKFNQSCPLPNESGKQIQNNTRELGPASGHNPVKFHGRRLRQRQEKNYYENSRRNNTAAAINSVKSLQLSPHKGALGGDEDKRQLSALKSSVQSYFRAGQTYRVLARRLTPGATPSYLIQWDS